jgi:DNA-binding response OmpR family regulator
MRILIIEDETRMVDLLRRGLYEREFTVVTATEGETGLAIAAAHEFDVIVLDIGLPQMDGFEVMRALRTNRRAIPVLMLTARDAEDDIIRGLDLGADDYLSKPFSFAELVARLQSITRHHHHEIDGTLEVGDVVVDLIRRSVTRNLVPIDVTRQEFVLLTCLLRRASECVPRKTLMESIWGSERAVGTSALDVLVNSLRSKIDTPFPKKLIGTVRGTGYVFHEAVTTVVSR